MIQVIDKRDGQLKATIKENDEVLKYLKKSGHYTFKTVKQEERINSDG